MVKVTGRVVLVADRGEPGPATLYVRLLDTSRLDAPWRVVAETILRDVPPDRLSKAGVDFCIVVADLDPRARYQVNALVDLDGDGQIGAGDYTSTRAYPVITGGHPTEVEILVHPVGGMPAGGAPKG